MIVLITPTGGRAIQINLCSTFMQRQTYTGKVVWIIIDDCEPRTTDFIPDDFREDWTIIKAYPVPLWNPSLNTQGRNLSVGINTLLQNYKQEDIEAVFIIEDDDYYKPCYIERMMLQMKGYKLIGEMDTVYYNVFYRRYFHNRNDCHASLFQIAFSAEAIPIFRECYPARFIDAHFFMLFHGVGVNLFNEDHLSIGIKGLPGRAGIGAGHGRAMNMRQDINMNYLNNLIGPDVNLYNSYFGGDRIQRRSLLNSRRR